MIYNDQILFNWSQNPTPQLIGEGDNQKKLVSYDDHVLGLQNAEQALGQKILQDNQDTLYTQNLITDQGIASVDPSTITLVDLAAEVLKLQTILSNLVQNPTQQ